MIDWLSAKWRRETFSFAEWHLDRKRDPSYGILDGVWVELEPNDHAPYGAYFKPTCQCAYPAAAREKIASDLAYDLGVPAVPVLLCDSGGRFGAQQDTCCVSLVTHPKTYPWEWVMSPAIMQDPLGQQIRDAASESLSRVAVFDLWIGNPDRAGNLIYCEDPGEPGRSGFRALDHSAAMGGVKQSWRDSGWGDVTIAQFPEPMKPLLSKSSMLAAIAAIEELSDDIIRECVNRIPKRYIAESSRDDTVNGLIGRKPKLSALVLQYFEKG